MKRDFWGIDGELLGWNRYIISNFVNVSNFGKPLIHLKWPFLIYCGEYIVNIESQFWKWIPVQMSNHLRMTNSFFRLDTNWLPIRLDTKWLLIGQYWRQWCCPWLNLKLFKGRHRNSNMEFLNIAQIFEHCPNFFEHRSKDLWFKGALPVPCALPLQFRPQKIFFFNLFLFFHYYYHF